MTRWKLTPLSDLPTGLVERHSEEFHDGDEASVQQRQNDLHAMTGVPFEATEFTEEAARADDERENEQLQEQQRRADEA